MMSPIVERNPGENRNSFFRKYVVHQQERGASEPPPSAAQTNVPVCAGLCRFVPVLCLCHFVLQTHFFFGPAVPCSQIGTLCFVTSCIKIAAAASGHHRRLLQHGQRRGRRAPPPRVLLPVLYPWRNGRQRGRRREDDNRLDGEGECWAQKWGPNNNNDEYDADDVVLASNNQLDNNNGNGGERGRGSGQKRPQQRQQNGAAITTAMNMMLTTWHWQHGQTDNQLDDNNGGKMGQGRGRKRPRQQHKNGASKTTATTNMTPKMREPRRRPCPPHGTPPSPDAPHSLCCQQGGNLLPLHECVRMQPAGVTNNEKGASELPPSRRI